MKGRILRIFCGEIPGLFLFGLILGVGVAFAGGRGEAVQKGITGNLSIVFMNDTHNHLYPYKDKNTGREYGGAARWGTIVKNIRQECGEVLFLHAGDILVGSDRNYLINGRPDRERLPGYGYRGLIDIPVFNMLGLEAFSPGNHEFDYGFYWNYYLFSKASFSALAANMTVRPVPASVSYNLPLYKPYQIFRKGNFLIGVIGLLTDEYIKTPQIKISDPVETVVPLLENLKKKCNVVVVLSHLGFEMDQMLASGAKGIDVIVGGHSHTLLSEPALVNGTIITQSRSFGEFVGRLDLEYQKGKLKNYRYQLVPADFSVSEDPEIKYWLNRWRYPVTLEHPLYPDGENNNSLGDYITGAISKKFFCDAVIIKIDGNNKELPAGRVTAEDFFSCFWPYRWRSDGPEKELSPEQVMDIVCGKAPATARFMLNNARGLKTLIAAEVPYSVLDDAEALNRERVGFGETFFINRLNSNVRLSNPSDNCKIVMDLPSWIDLYQEGILIADYKYQNLKKEIIDVLLKEIQLPQ